jgi:hypothetical protein
VSSDEVAKRFVCQRPPTRTDVVVEPTGVVNVPTRRLFCGKADDAVRVVCTPAFGIVIKLPDIGAAPPTES